MTHIGFSQAIAQAASPPYGLDLSLWDPGFRPALDGRAVAPSRTGNPPETISVSDLIAVKLSGSAGILTASLTIVEFS